MNQVSHHTPRIAVLLPCYNEGKAIASVVQAFSITLPHADIYVYDNNSSDDTYLQAKKAGAIVRQEFSQGKGHVVRRMFADIDADIYVMADGDGTYDTPSTPKLIEALVNEQLDMVIGTRAGNDKAYRAGHQFGNRLFNAVLKWTFNSHFTDIFSGFRVFSRRFVKSFPALSTGFDIETELSVHALEMAIPTREIPTPFHDRIAGTESKLNTFKDGFRILWRMCFLFKEIRPFIFFGTVAGILAFASLLLGYPVIKTYFVSKWVYKVPTAILAAGLMILSFINLTCGLILSSISYGRKENKKLVYLNVSTSCQNKT
ncbi:MAG: hypothetical protein RLZ35_199 [Pseudomonadota bacterium]|jgi:glycosyltransferase involved in cell wall biosynthesis